jgi:hypothetical protein
MQRESSRTATAPLSAAGAAMTKRRLSRIVKDADAKLPQPPPDRREAVQVGPR